METLLLAGFLTRVREGKSVSQFDFALGFKWTREASLELVKVVGELRAVGTRADLSGSDLSWSNLSGSNLSGSNLSGSNLSRSNLSGSNLSRSDLSRSDLSWSDLSWSNLSESDLSGSNLSGSNLSWSDLSWSDLSRSDLSWSNLSGSNLSGSNLSGIHGAVGFAFSLPCGVSLAELLKTVKCDEKTRDYLTIQTLARLSWEAKEGVMPYMRKWFECEQTTKKPATKTKRKKEKEARN